MFLTLSPILPVTVHYGGWFVCRGTGIHPDRMIRTYELILVRTGTLSIQEEQQAFEVHAGQTLLLWEGRRHFGTRPYPPDLSFYWIHFHVLPHDGEGTLTIPQYATLPRPEDAAELFRRLLHGQETGQLSPLTSSLLLLVLLSEVAAASESKTDSSATANSVITRAASYIRTHFHHPISAADVAAHLGYNVDYIGRIYRQVQGVTLNEAIEEERLLQARRLLLDSNANVDEVARATGFVDANYFRRRFKRREGVSPGVFRRLHARAHINTE